MFLKYMMLAAAFAMAVPASAQDATDDQPAAAPVERQAVPRGTRPQGDNPRTGTAVARTPRESPPPPASRAAAPAPGAAAPAAQAAPAEGQAVPRGTRPQGDNPRTGTAVVRTPRESPPPPADRGRNDRGRSDNVYRGGTVIVNPPPIYNNNYYYPRRYYPYGYGAFGLGYFYYDPYRWYPGSYSAYGPGYYPRYGSGSVFDIGELRLQVSPRHAQVFVDGYYAGTVDDYDGAFQALKLESGPYSIRIAAPGYEDLMFDVRISPGQKINYRGDLPRRRP